MKAVIYTRVSTEEQAKENRTSLTFQREQSEDYCELMGHEVWEVIVDAGYSGLSLDTPGLRRIQELAQTEAFILVAWSSDRLARDIIRRRLLAETMKDAGG
ncbi:MAG: recombinase family protein, partial [Dehalococcoidia bacterium]